MSLSIRPSIIIKTQVFHLDYLYFVTSYLMELWWTLTFIDFKSIFKYLFYYNSLSSFIFSLSFCRHLSFFCFFSFYFYFYFIRKQNHICEWVSEIRNEWGGNTNLKMKESNCKQVLRLPQLIVVNLFLKKWWKSFA